MNHSCGKRYGNSLCGTSLWTKLLNIMNQFGKHFVAHSMNLSVNHFDEPQQRTSLCNFLGSILALWTSCASSLWFTAWTAQMNHSNEPLNELCWVLRAYLLLFCCYKGLLCEPLGEPLNEPLWWTTEWTFLEELSLWILWTSCRSSIWKPSWFTAWTTQMNHSNEPLNELRWALNAYFLFFCCNKGLLSEPLCELLSEPLAEPLLWTIPRNLPTQASRRSVNCCLIVACIVSLFCCLARRFDVLDVS